jgi:hypothetical protein
MSIQFTTDVSTAFSKFKQDADVLLLEISSTKAPLKDHSASGVTQIPSKTIEDYCSAIEDMKTRGERILFQASQTHTTALGQLQQETDEKNAKLQEAISSLRYRFLKIELTSALQGTVNHLMFTPMSKERDTHRFPKENLVEFLNKLEKRVLYKSLATEIKESEIKKCLSTLHTSLQYRIDFFVYLFSKDKLKEGHEWGKCHRYDNLAVLRKALGAAIFEHIKGYAEHKTKSLKQASINGPSYLLLLCKAILNDMNEEVFQDLFCQGVQSEVVSRGLTERPSIFVEKSDLEKAQERLSVICKINDVDESSKRDCVRGMLDLLSEQDRCAIEEKVYLLSKDPRKEDPFWRRDHAYDDLNVLLLAIEERIAKLLI